MSGSLDPAPSRGRLWWEVAIVLSLGLGQSAIYSIVALIRNLTREESLSQQSTAINTPLSAVEAFDFVYQLLAIVFALTPALLACFFLWSSRRPHFSRLGLVATHPLSDGIRGLVLAVVIGSGGIAIYLGAKALDANLNVSASSLGSYWWSIPMLMLSALRAGLQEEIVVLGYLFARLQDLGWARWQIVIGSAMLRGSYHLYQGFGAFVGNLIMGAIFGWLYTRWGRVIPFIVAHAVIDAAIFIGYPWAAATFPELFASIG